MLAPGDVFVVEASGTWTSGAWTGGPQGQPNQVPTTGSYILLGSVPYCLVGRIGADGEPFTIGGGGVFTADRSGELVLSMNDALGVYWDNSGAITATISAGSSAWPLIYDSSADDFGSWQTNHPEKFFWDSAAPAYHYAITDGADDYAFASVPTQGGSFALEFDVFPEQTNWGGNFRLGMWDAKMRQETASCAYAHYHFDSNGQHIYLQCYWPTGDGSVRPSGYSDWEWYHTLVFYSAANGAATITVTRMSDGVTVTGTVENVGPFEGLDRIAMTSIGDTGYPGAGAWGFIKNVKLSGSGQESAVFDSPTNGARFMLAPRALLPIKFHLVDGQGNPIMERREVTLEVTEVSSPTIKTAYLFSAANGSLQFSTLRGPQYVAPFRRVTIWTSGGGACTAVVKANGQPIGSIAFNISSMYSRFGR
jgi:hypothetical protein